MFANARDRTQVGTECRPVANAGSLQLHVANAMRQEHFDDPTEHTTGQSDSSGTLWVSGALCDCYVKITLEQPNPVEHASTRATREHKQHETCCEHELEHTRTECRLTPSSPLSIEPEQVN